MMARAKNNPLFGKGRPRLFGTPFVPPKAGISSYAPPAKTAKQKPTKATAAKNDYWGGSGTWPSERIFQDGFKRGMTAREIIAANPALQALRKSNPAKFDRCVKAVQAKGRSANAYAVCTAAGTRDNPPYSIVAEDGHELGLVQSREAAFSEARSYAGSGQRVEVVWKGRKGYESKWFGRKRRNPAAASAEAFKEFHGFEPSGVVTVTKKVHHHAHLASLGVLMYLEVWGIDKAGHTLNGFKEAILACSEDRNQLFIEGGDQALDLASFGIQQAHELETIGKVLTVAYATDKKHLGAEGGKAVYVHDFTTTNENGKHVKVPEARLPQLIYDVRNEQLLFSGGSYEIIAEGIDK